MRFLVPWAVVLIVALPIVVVAFVAHRRRAGGRFEQRFTLAALVLRLLTLLTLVLVVAGVQHRQSGAGADVVFVIDRSDSVAPVGREQAKEFVDRALAAQREGDRAAIVIVGANAVVERALGPDITRITSDTTISGSGTALADGVTRALTLFTDERERSIVVVSDGLENRGDLMGAARLAARAGVTLFTVPLRTHAADGEVFIRRVVAPSQTRVGATHELSVIVGATESARASIVILRDDEYYGEDAVELAPGDNVVTFEARFDEPGMRTYTVRVDAPGDSVAQNNEATAVVRVVGEPEVLYVAQNDSPSLIGALRAQGLRVTTGTSDRIPGDVSGLLRYDLVVLDNVPAYDLSLSRMDALERYVRDSGGGIVAVGGDRSFGPGGYHQTPLERLLPVDMDAASTMKVPSLSMLFVIDKSGSMGSIDVSGLTKLDLVKEAVISAIEIMNPFHMVGLLAFDADHEWIVPMTQAGERDAIVGNLARLEPGGGTVLEGALAEALETLLSTKSSIRHVIVLSDGLTSDGDLEPLVRDLSAASITVSTVSVGSSADRRLMREIAEWGRGRSYHAADAAGVPRIFADETSIVSRNMIVEETFVPTVRSTESILAGIDPWDIPALRGFVLTYLKPDARMLLSGPGDNPVISAWQYGLGRSVAVTTDLRARWAREWVDWTSYPRLVGQMARWAQRRADREGIRVSISTTGGRASVVVDARDDDQSFRNHLALEALVQPPRAPSYRIGLRQSRPGEYRGEFDADAEGLYLVTIDGDDEGPPVTHAIDVRSTDEYTRFETDYALLDEAAAIGGGRMLTNEEAASVFASSGSSATYSDLLWRLLAFGALALLLAELVVRKLR